MAAPNTRSIMQSTHAPHTQSLRIGVIGAGGRGWLSQHAHQPEAGVRIVAIADTDPAAIKAYREKYGADLYATDDYRKLLKEGGVDAVFVCTPDFLHEEHACAALEAGKHVYLEKPMAITIAGCDRILRTAMETKTRLYLGHNMRHMDFVLKMRELIAQGVIGEVKTAWCRHFCSYGGDAYFKDWHADRTKSTGLLLQKAAHDIDVLHWVCGGFTTRTVGMGGLTLYDRITDRHPPEERGDASWNRSNWPPLTQKGLNPVIDVEDLSMILMRLDNGVQCSYQQCHYAPDGWRNYTFIGTEGRIENQGDRPGDCVIKVWNQQRYYNQYGNAIHYIDEAADTHHGHGGADPRIVREFIAHVRDGVKMTTSPVAARHSVATGYAATMSIRANSQPMDVPPVAPDVAAYFAQLTQ